MPDPLDPDAAALLATLGRLRRALDLLTLATLPGRARHRPTAPGELARARADADRRAERADTYLTGYGLGVDQPAPVRLAPLVAQLDAHDRIRATARATAANLGRRHVTRPATDRDQAAALAWVTAAGDPLAALDWLGWLAESGRLVADAAATVTRDLAAADRTARTGAGLGEERRPLYAACPACARRSLYVETSSDQEAGWLVGCDRNACRCLGPACGCGRHSTWPGRRHLWPYDEWPALAARLALPAAWRAAPAVACPCLCHNAQEARCDVVGGCDTIGCQAGSLGRSQGGLSAL